MNLKSFRSYPTQSVIACPNFISLLEVRKLFCYNKILIFHLLRKQFCYSKLCMVLYIEFSITFSTCYQNCIVIACPSFRAFSRVGGIFLLYEILHNMPVRLLDSYYIMLIIVLQYIECNSTNRPQYLCHYYNPTITLLIYYIPTMSLNRL